MKYFSQCAALYSLGLSQLAAAGNGKPILNEYSKLLLENSNSDEALAFAIEKTFIEELCKFSDEQIFSIVSKHFADMSVISGLSLRDSAIHTIALGVTIDLFKSQGRALDKSPVVAVSGVLQRLEQKTITKPSVQLSLEDRARLAQEEAEKAGDCSGCIP